MLFATASVFFGKAPQVMGEGRYWRNQVIFYCFAFWGLPPLPFRKVIDRVSDSSAFRLLDNLRRFVGLPSWL